MCSTYSMRTLSGPQRKTAYVFGASTTSSISTPRSFAAAMCSSADSTRTARWLSSGRSGAPGSPGWNSTHAPPTSTRGAPDGTGRSRREAERAVLAAQSPRGSAEKSATWSRSYSTSVVGLDEPEAHAFAADVEVGLAVARALELEVRPAAPPAPRRDSRPGTRRASSAPRSRGPSASNRVILPRRAFEPSSVNRSVRSMTCIPRCAVTKSATASRSASQ